MSEGPKQDSEQPTPAAARPAAPGTPKPEAKAAPPPGPPDQAPPAGMAVPEYVSVLQTDLPGAVEQVSFWVGDWTVIVPAGRLVEVATFLRDRPGCLFDYLSDLTAVDWPMRDKRFDLVLCLYSIRLR